VQGKEHITTPVVGGKEPSLVEILEKNLPSFQPKKTTILKVNKPTELYDEIEKYLLAAEVSQAPHEFSVSVVVLDKEYDDLDDLIDNGRLLSQFFLFLLLFD